MIFFGMCLFQHMCVFVCVHHVDARGQAQVSFFRCHLPFFLFLS